MAFNFRLRIWNAGPRLQKDSDWWVVYIIHQGQDRSKTRSSERPSWLPQPVLRPQDSSGGRRPARPHWCLPECCQSLRAKSCRTSFTWSAPHSWRCERVCVVWLAFLPLATTLVEAPGTGQAWGTVRTPTLRSGQETQTLLPGPSALLETSPGVPRLLTKPLPTEPQWGTPPARTLHSDCSGRAGCLPPKEGTALTRVWKWRVWNFRIACAICAVTFSEYKLDFF